VRPLCPFEFTAVLPVDALQHAVVVATQAFQFAAQLVAHARDLGLGRLAGLPACAGFRSDTLQLRFEGRDTSRRFSGEPLPFRVQFLPRPRAFGIAFHVRCVPDRGDRLIHPLLRAGFELPAQLLFRRLKLERGGFPCPLLTLRLRGGHGFVQPLIELVAEALFGRLVFERRSVPTLDLPLGPRGGDLVLQPLLELLTDPLFGALPFSGSGFAAALFPPRLGRGRGVGELVLEFLPDTLFGRLPFGGSCFAAALFAVRLRRRHSLSELVVELLAQLMLEGLPFRRDRRAATLFAIRTRLGDQVRHVRLHLFLDLRDTRFRCALRLEQGLLTRFGNLAFVLLLQGGELLVERASKLRLQIVKGHRG